MNKPLVITGVILIILGAIGGIYIFEFIIAIIFGIPFIIIGALIDIGRIHKKLHDTEDNIEFCPNCGAAVKKGANFCPYCRKKL
ncbi:MAG: zinc ribbon domain-containing protein [Candidatus Helarchaeota archaeon]